MAFNRDNFGPIGNVSKRGNAPVMWGYKSADAIATVNTSGYFDSVSDLVTVGDMIYCFDNRYTNCKFSHCFKQCFRRSRCIRWHRSNRS